jgi:anaerobic selenocysteine-containing dehydrogenase
MCTVRCPIKVNVQNGKVVFIQGNPHVPAMKGAVCPRGAAGTGLIYDSERPQTPLIREGKRGEGKWRKATWEEALDHVADKLNEVKHRYGAKAIALSDRGGPFRDFHRAFLRGLGTPNYNNHDSSCARNVQHSALSLTGKGRKAVAYDYKHSRHVVLQFRNIFESIDVQEVNNLMDAMEKGCKLTVIDVRANVSAGKAHHFFMVRPGTDYAFNLAVINEIIAKRFYDDKFKKRYIEGFDELTEFVSPYTPEWAEQETGVPASHLWRFVKDLARAAPAVIWHPGWMAARYKHSFYVCRSIYIINALLGAYGAKGGLPFVSKPGDVGRSGLKKFMDLYPKPDEKRADWEIISGLARRMNLPELVFERIEDIWNFQLQGTGVTIEDFDATGMVPLVDKPVYPEFENYGFKTPSKKIEIISRKLTDSGLDSLAPYEPPVSPDPGRFRLTFGRCALHTQGHTVNNPLLSEQMPENHLWINKTEAEKLDIVDGDRVQVSQNGYSEFIQARVTEAIHPDAVFVVHGFGHRLPVETRAFNKGLADNRFMAGGLDIWDRAGGAIAFQEHFVTVSKS